MKLVSTRNARSTSAREGSLDAWPYLERVREAAPLVHSITNYVAMNNSANALLAVGASPAMVHAEEEVEEFTSISAALVINIGTLSEPWVRGMRLAARQALDKGIPWVLDPVGAGATRYRTSTAAELASMTPTVIRGNASEIMVLAGATGAAGKGVDSAHESEAALEHARALARSSGSIVGMTGAVDYVTDGSRTVSITNGSAMMGRVTGLGCSASAVVGAFVGANEERFPAVVAALATFAIAGELAAESSPGPGSLQLRLLDALYNLDESALRERARISELT